VSAKSASEILGLNYKSIESRYKDLRKYIVIYLEEKYKNRKSDFTEYEEYYYLPQKKRGRVKYLFDAIPILGTKYEDFVYTLLLPNLFEFIKEEDAHNATYIKEYAQFLNRYKIIHYQKFDNLLVRFWLHVENEMLRFKGVAKENFIYYLKECEFKFNFSEKEQNEILTNLWFNKS
jgi:transposase-like protein